MPKKNIVIAGMMGCGKTAAGKELAEKTGRAFMDTDIMIAEKEGKSISQIFIQNGEHYFRALEKECIINLAEQYEQVIALGGGAVMNDDAWNRLRQNGITLFLDFPCRVLARRLEEDHSRPLLKSMNMAEKEKELSRLLKTRRPRYEQAEIILRFHKETDIDEIVRKIIRSLPEGI